jgi:hypothetical protein
MPIWYTQKQNWVPKQVCSFGVSVEVSRAKKEHRKATRRAMQKTIAAKYSR